VSRRPHIKHQPIAEGLRERPGEWGRVGNYWWQTSAKYALRMIEDGKTSAYQPAGSFEAEIHIGHDGDPIVWARYVGATAVSA